MKRIATGDLEQLDEQLRLGNVKGVRKIIRTISPTKVARQDLLKLANLSRRSGLVDFGMRILNPIVRSDVAEREKATPEERIEYAVLLSRVGATGEARQILEEIDSRAFPESILYRTFTLTPEWNYRETIPLLEEYITVATHNPYMQLVAKVNLAAALVFIGEHEKASKVIGESLRYAQTNNHKLLSGNLLELAAQSAIGQKEFQAAESYLKESSKIMSGSETSESLYVEKWKAVLRVLRRQGRKQRDNLLSVRAKAVAQNDWEIVRDCDYHLATNFNDDGLLVHLYFGTPYRSYREKLARILPGLTKIKTYVWNLSEHGHEATVLDLTTGKSSDDVEVVSPHQLPHRLLSALAQDFYRPQRFAALGAKLFPGEFFNPISTPVRIHKACTRLRQVFEEQNVPIELDVRANSVRLRGSANLKITKSNQPLFVDISQRKLNDHVIELHAKLKTKKFTSTEAAKIWNCSLSTASRRISEALELNLCQQVGSGRGTAFILK